MPAKRIQIILTREMVQTAKRQIEQVRVVRDQASAVDTLTGILGEYVFALYFYGDWRFNRVTQNRGKSDFPHIEIKTSAFPYSDKLNLLVREEYASRREPPFYVQIIIDTPNARPSDIQPGMRALIAGFATHEEVSGAPLGEFGAKEGFSGNYLCHYIPLSRLHPMNEFPTAYCGYLWGECQTQISGWPVPLKSLGNPNLLKEPSVAIFSSRGIPPGYKKEIFKAIQNLAQLPNPLISSWHSQLEQHLQKQRRPENGGIIFLTSREPDKSRLSPTVIPFFGWHNALLLQLPPKSTSKSGWFEQRNQLIMQIAKKVVFLYVRPSGMVEDLLKLSLQLGKIVYVVDIIPNRRWIKPPVRPLSAEIAFSI
ncbi:MAG: hypothetical protein Kow0037_11010 [Calditrichia bacterium]